MRFSGDGRRSSPKDGRGQSFEPAEDLCLRTAKRPLEYATPCRGSLGQTGLGRGQCFELAEELFVWTA